MSENKTSLMIVKNTFRYASSTDPICVATEDGTLIEGTRTIRFESTAGEVPKLFIEAYSFAATDSDELVGMVFEGTWKPKEK